MRKLNRKGFTLVELLAVIVILAIVVGIALTTVLPTLKKSRQEAFNLTANTAADFLEKQYQLSLLGDVSGKTLVITDIPKGTDSTAARLMTADDLKKAGLKSDNYVIGDADNKVTTWYINTNTGRACVRLKAKTTANAGEGNSAGEYYDVDPDEAISSGC